MANTRIDCAGRMPKGRKDMKRLLCSTLLIAAAALAGCDQSDHNLAGDGPYDPNANLTNNSAPVTLPPSIAAQKSYRCKDNSIVYVDWYSDGSARLKKDRTEAGTLVQATDLKGDAKSTTITANGQSCKA
jgi:hypothetical protein